MTNDTNWTPQPGDTVYAKLYVDRHDGDREGNRPWRCLDASNYPRAFNTADLAPYPPQREPWTVLREAACVVEARRGSALADMMRREADTMQHEATPAPASPRWRRPRRRMPCGGRCRSSKKERSDG